MKPVRGARAVGHAPLWLLLTPMLKHVVFRIVGINLEFSSLTIGDLTAAMQLHLVLENPQKLNTMDL